MRRIVLSLAALAMLVAMAVPGQAAPAARVALVIGNGAYRHVDTLRNPDTDARLMAATLRGLGFTLVGGGAQLDLDRAGMESAIHRFHAAIAPGSVAFFYYSGHGVQVDGANYLVPVSAAPATEADVPVQMVAADLVLQDMADAGAALNIVVLDACRNNPFAAMMAQEGARGLRPGAAQPAAGNAAGLAEMHAPRDTLISFATQPGAVAYDGAAGAPDSPYTTALAGTLRQPGLDVVRAFNRAGIEVGRLTAQRQEPWLAISPLEDDVFLAGPAASGAQPAPPSQARPMAAARAARMPSRPVAPAAMQTAPACPQAGLRAVRNGAEPVRYQGAAPGAPGTCLADVAGVAQARVGGIWPANWPGATAAETALRRVLAGPPGSTASFTQTADVAGIRDTVNSESWRFTLTNEGPATLAVAGTARPARLVRWEERDLSHSYLARAEITLDARTGAVLAQSFRVLSGGTAAAYQFWSAYQGGVGGVADFRVTALN